MNKDIQTLLNEIHTKNMKKIVKDHVKKIDFDENAGNVSVFVDKKYAVHLLNTNKAKTFSNSLKKRFGEDISITYHLLHPHHAHERENRVPHAIHF